MGLDKMISTIAILACLAVATGRLKPEANFLFNEVFQNSIMGAFHTERTKMTERARTLDVAETKLQSPRDFIVVVSEVS